jgi:hypothetical protein
LALVPGTNFINVANLNQGLPTHGARPARSLAKCMFESYGLVDKNYGKCRRLLSFGVRFLRVTNLTAMAMF